MALGIGVRLGPYEIIAPVGAGGMGEVYRAHDTRLNRDVALKILPHAWAQDPDRLRRFHQEAQAAGSLNHPNIVAVHDVGQSDGVTYAITELLEGETLRQRLSGAPLPLRKAIDFAVQITRGLAAAHAKGIAHRDIKPENLFVTRDGFVKILDFGLAKMTAVSAASGTSAPTQVMETSPGVVMGTAGYMAPEQVRGATSDYRCDIFSLGAVLYEMLAGRRAFSANTAAETMSAIVRDDPPELPDAVPAVLGSIVRRCMEKRPEDRFESMRDLGFAMESITTASRSERLVPAKRGLHRVAWRAGLALLIAAVLVAALIGTWGLARRTASVELSRFQQVTFRRGLVSGAHFSGDGKTIIYSAAWDGKSEELFSTLESSPESRPLGIPNAHVASISRAGEMALILESQPGIWLVPKSGTLARAPVGGGAPREVAENVTFADWSPDGTQLAVVREVPGGQVLEYPVGNVLYRTPGMIFMPKVSPDGKSVVFEDGSLADPSATIVLVDASGRKRALTRRFETLAGHAWSADGAEIWFAGTDSGVNMSIDAVDLKGNVRTILPLPGMFALLDAASDGRLLLMRDSFVASMFVRPAGAVTETDLYWHDNSIARDISPDGTQILFSEGGASTTTDWITYMRNVNGSSAIRLGNGLATAFSPDGKWAMTNPADLPHPLVAYPTHAGDTRKLVSDTIDHLSGVWLKDGKRIVFVGNEPNHLSRYYVQDSPGSKPRAISGENIAFSRLEERILSSPDGASVAASVKGEGIQLLPVNGGAPRSIPDTNGFSPIAWCGDNSLLVSRLGTIPVQVVKVDLQSGKQRVWKELAPRDRTALSMLSPVRFAADCETYAYTAQYDPSTLTVVKVPIAHR